MQRFILILKKAHFCAFFILLQSCCGTCKFWELEEVNTHCQEFNSSRLNSVQGVCKSSLELAIYRNNDGEKLFINIHGCPLPPQEIVQVVVIIDDEERMFDAAQFLGGQRILLPEEAANRIIAALYDSKNVIVKVGPYTREFESDNFPELYVIE